MNNFRGKNALNTVQPQPQVFNDAYGSIRLARDTVTEDSL